MAYRFTKELEIIKEVEEKSLVSNSYNKIDKTDLLLSVGVGAVSGIVDILFVGSATTIKEDSSVLTKWSDKKVDDTIKRFSKLLGWNPREGNEDNVKSAIGFLERNFKVNYDHRHSGDVGNLFKMNTKDHHLKSLGHSPDIIGLFFSIINQFTSTASFVSDGQLITIHSETMDLKGSNFVAKLFSGFVNWFVHLLSDVGGSSGASQRGSGIAMPFYSLTQFLNVGKFDVGKDKQTIAEIANRAFREGYDFRHGIANAIPVLLTEIIIRFLWSVRACFQHDYSLKELIPNLQNNDSLRRMLLMGHGTLSILDGIDAGIKSSGNALVFVNNLNLIAWLRLSLLVLKEISVVFNINLTTYEEIEEIYQEFHLEISNQLNWFKESNFEEYQYEITQYNYTLEIVKKDLNTQELNREFHILYKQMELEFPWEGDFDLFMNNKQTLKFRRNEE